MQASGASTTVNLACLRRQRRKETRPGMAHMRQGTSSRRCGSGWLARRNTAANLWTDVTMASPGGWGGVGGAHMVVARMLLRCFGAPCSKHCMYTPNEIVLYEGRPICALGQYTYLYTYMCELPCHPAERMQTTTALTAPGSYGANSCGNRPGTASPPASCGVCGGGAPTRGL